MPTNPENISTLPPPEVAEDKAEAIGCCPKSARRREPPKVLLIHEHLMRLQCMEFMLSSQARDLRVMGVTRIEEAVERPDLVVVVRSLGTEANDLQSRAEAVQSKLGDLPIVVVCEPSDLGLVASAMRDKVRAFIPNTVSVNVALAVLRLVLAGGTYFPEEMVDRIAGRMSFQRQPMNPERTTVASTEFRLTDREGKVLDQLRQGKPNKIIAYALGISESTVKVHLRSLMRKLRSHVETDQDLVFDEQDRLGLI